MSDAPPIIDQSAPAKDAVPAAAFGIRGQTQFGDIRRRFFRNKGYMVVPYKQAPAIMKRLLEGEIEPSRSEDAQEEITQQAWKAAKRITKFPGHGGPFHESFSEILDWNDPPPPLAGSVLSISMGRMPAPSAYGSCFRMRMRPIAASIPRITDDGKK